MTALIEYAELKALFSNADALPQAPKSPLRLSALLDMPDASPVEIESLILADPALTAGILKAASSAIFGRSRRVTTVREAVMILGFKALRAMAVALWTQALLVESRHQTLLDPERFARNGSFVGHLASGLYHRNVGRNGNNVSAEEVYACGVLHNMGVGLLSLLAPNVFDTIYGYAKDHTITIEQAFLMVYGNTLNGLAGDAARTMGLPELFCDAIQHFDAPANALDLEFALVHLNFAHYVGEDRGMGVGRWSVPYSACESVSEIVNISDDELDEHVAIARKNLLLIGIRSA